MVETAQMNKAPVQAYADRIAGMFTPMVLCVAVLTFLTWAMLAWMHRYYSRNCLLSHADVILRATIDIFIGKMVNNVTFSICFHNIGYLESGFPMSMATLSSSPCSLLSV
jgi:hypothetical protein